MKTRKVLAGLMLSALVSGCFAGAALAGDEDPQVVLKLATTSTDETSDAKACYKLAEDVAAASNGSITIEVYPSSQLGDQTEVVEGLQLGTVEMTDVSIAAFENIEPRLAAYSLPFCFKDTEAAEKYFESDYGQKVIDDLREEQGIRIFYIFAVGTRDVFTKDKIESIDDFKGLKIRVPDIPIYVNMFSALGCNPTPLALGECYTGLQTGLIDGIELVPTYIVTNNIQEVIGYGLDTNHMLVVQCFAMSEDAFQSMSENQQQILIDCMAENKEYVTDLIAQDEAHYMGIIEEAGVEFEAVSPEFLDQFREKVSEVIDGYAADIISEEELDFILGL